MDTTVCVCAAPRAVIETVAAPAADAAVEPAAEPEVIREVSLVSIAGRRFSPAVAAFARAIRGYRWPEAPEEAA